MAAKKSPGTDLAPRQGGALTPWQAKMDAARVKRMERAAEVATGTAPKLVFGPTGISLNKGPAVSAVQGLILATHFYREYYDQPYDEKNPTGPRCYSFDEDEPHPKSFEKQHDTCQGCQWDAFDSNPNGRGSKGCSEVARIAVIAVDDLKKKDLSKIEPAVARVSVLNRKVLARFEAAGATPDTLVRIGVTAVPGTTVGYDLSLDAMSRVPLSPEAQDTIGKLMDMAEKKFNEPLPDYKAPASGKTKKNRFSK